MAEENKNQKPETPEGKTETRKTAATVTRGTDHVAMVSRRADGTPDQTKDFKVIGDED